MPWRRAYECYAAVIWCIAGVAFVLLAARGKLPWLLASPILGLSLAIALCRAGQGLRILVLRASLSGRAIQMISTRAFRRFCTEPEQVFLGFGFEWLPLHSQRLYELAKVNFRDFVVSPRLLRCLGYPVKPQP